MAQASVEQQIYSDANVLVSTSRIIVNGVTYPLSNISSVRLFVKKPNFAFPCFLVLVGFCLFFAGPNALVWAALCLIIGVALFFVLKADYTMLIGSAGGEKSALTSKDGRYMNNIVAHVNDAIVVRG